MTTEDASSSNRKSFRWLSEILEDPDALKPPKPVAPRLAWDKRLTLLAAREKAGKSTLASAAAAAVSSGRPFLGAPCVASNVLIISLEEHASDFSTRLVNFGCDPTRIAVIDNTSYHDAKSLIEAIWTTAEVVAPELIIWDTLGAFANAISGKTLDPGDGPAWTRVMMEILDVARTFGASLLLHHARKSDGKYRDSSAIGANVDVIMEMFGENDEPRTLKSKGRFEIPEVRVKLEADGFKIVENAADFEKRVLEFIRANPKCSMRDLREGVEGKNADLARVRDKLLKEGMILNVGTHAAHAYATPDARGT